MAQRILIATCFLLVAACFGLVGIVWSASNRWSQANLILIDQSQRTNQEILKHLEALTKASQTTPTADAWIPVSFRLTVETLDGPPAVEYEITLGKGEGGTREDGRIRRLTDARGLADFGVITPGDWEYRIEAHCDETRYWLAVGNLNAVPGTRMFERICCPKRHPDRAPVQVQVAWPEDLSSKNLRVFALFRHQGHTYQSPLWWRMWDPHDQQSTRSREMLCGPGSQQAEIVEEDYPQFWRPATEREKSADYFPGMALYGSTPKNDLSSNRVFARFGSGSDSPGASAIEIEAGAYRPERLIVLQASGTTNSGTKRWEVLAMGGSPQINVYAMNEASGSLISSIGETLEAPTKTRSLRGLGGHFEVQPGQVNEWTIALPEDLIKAIREKLSARR